MQGKRVREAVWVQMGRISSRVSCWRMMMGNGTTSIVWGKRIEFGPPKRAIASHCY